MTKCENCSSFFKYVYTTLGGGGKKVRCLILGEELSPSIDIKECNQFKPEGKLKTKRLPSSRTGKS